MTDLRTVATIAELIDACGGPTKFGRAIWPGTKKPAARAGTARWRGSIPLPRWTRVIGLAERHGIQLTAQQLAEWKRRETLTRRRRAQRAA
jgi:hypothetical protein